MIISILVASAQNLVIGIENRLPWKLSADLKNFKQLTTGHTVLMGRRTFESIGQALPNRHNMVLSTHTLPAQPDVAFFADLPTAIAEAQARGESELFIIGGAKLYAQTIDLAHRLYWTKVHAQVEGDAFFLPPDLTAWQLTQSEKYFANEKNEFDFTIETWEK